MKIIRSFLSLLVAFVSALAQSKPAPPVNSPSQNQTPTTIAKPAASTPQVPSGSPADSAPKAPDKAAAYYHYALAHSYEEMVALYGRAEYASKAIDEYKQAIANDPKSEFLNSGLAELYAKTNRIREAVLEAQTILDRDPNNVEARKLLGRIYLRSLGDLQAGTQSQEVLKLAISQFEQIVKLEPGAVDNHLLLGRLYILNKDLLKAEAEFKTAISIQPDSEEGITNLAYLYNEQGETSKAAKTLTSIPESGRSAKLYMALGYTYEQQHEPKKAVAAYKKAVALDHDNLDAVRGLAQNMLNDGQLEASLEQYKQIVESDPQDAQAQLRIAEIQRRTGKLDAALDSLKKTETLVQDSLEVPYNYALVYAAQGRYDEAIQKLNALLDKTARPDSKYTQSEGNNRAVFLERLGGLYRETSRPQQAIETFRKMLVLNDETASRGYEQMVDTYRDMKDWPQATTAAKEGIAKYPNDRNLKLMLAGQLADMGHADEGVSMARSMLKGNSPKEDREVWIAISQIYSRLKRWSEAEDAVAKAAEFSSNQEEKDYVAFVEGSIYERQKKYDLAEDRFRRVLATDPQNAMALNYLGYMLADRGVRLDEAVNYIKKALEIDPQNGAYLDSIGWAYYKQGKYDLAEDSLRKAVTRVGNDATLHQHLGDLYLKTGRLKLAAAHWERALEEWNKSVPAEVEAADVAKVQRQLESARVQLARQQAETKPSENK